MKRIFILLGILTVFVVGCEVHPYADFLVDKKYAQPYETINFTNLSERGSSYQWDFCDGTITNIYNPSHVYTYEGTFEVILTVTSRDGNRDVATFIVEVYYPDLEITVAEWNQEEIIYFIVPGASVRLYSTLSDWVNQRNMVVEGFTDDNGIVTFFNLNSQEYYIDVWQEFYDNWDFYPDYTSYITTQWLQPAQLNTFIAWADYYPPTIKRSRIDKNLSNKKSSKDRTLIVKDLST
jgi:PKD repeat protein